MPRAHPRRRRRAPRGGSRGARRMCGSIRRWSWSSILTASRGGGASGRLVRSRICSGAHAGLGPGRRGFDERLRAAAGRAASVRAPSPSRPTPMPPGSAPSAASDGAILILGTGSCGLAVVGGRQLLRERLGRRGVRRGERAYGSAARRSAARSGPMTAARRSTPLAERDPRALRRRRGEDRRFRHDARARRLSAAGAAGLRACRAARAAGAGACRRGGGRCGAHDHAAARCSARRRSACSAGWPSRSSGWLPPPIRARICRRRCGDALDGAILLARRAQRRAAPAARRGHERRMAREGSLMLREAREAPAGRGAAARGERRDLPRARRAPARSRRRPSRSAARAAAPTTPRPTPNISWRSGSAW